MRSLNIAAQNSGKWTPPARTRSSLSATSSSPPPSWRTAAKSSTTKSPTATTIQDEEPEFSLSELVVSSEKSSSTSNSNALHESSFPLFDSKTEIEYLDDQDDLAARVYGDRGKSNKNSSNDSSAALGTSGYNFDSLLSS